MVGNEHKLRRQRRASDALGDEYAVVEVVAGDGEYDPAGLRRATIRPLARRSDAADREQSQYEIPVDQRQYEARVKEGRSPCTNLHLENRITE